MLSNGNLNEGDGDEFTSWGKWNGGPNLTAVTDSCSGRALQAASSGGNAWELQFVSDEVTMVADTQYTASMWIKADAADGIVRFSLNGASPQYGVDETVATGDWQQITSSFTANDTNTRLLLDLGASSVTYTIDNIALVEGGTALAGVCPENNPELLLNSDLETGDGGEFTNWGKWNGDTVLTVTTTEVHSGSRALQAASPGGNAWEVQFVSDAATTEVGKAYTASMWIKGAVADGVVRFSTNTDGATDAQYGPDTTIGTDWQNITWGFTADSTSTRLVLDLGASNVTYYIDEISLKE
ncbi:carbohydrate binding domain-containing protein [Teredinibacter franksiae]|uniref:carbohydrate binding domain-containing protein n=1 Tax=Teredinibacter franksiae TaxID=2761453 RepID=UPI00406C3AA7